MEVRSNPGGIHIKQVWIKWLLNPDPTYSAALPNAPKSTLEVELVKRHEDWLGNFQAQQGVILRRQITPVIQPKVNTTEVQQLNLVSHLEAVDGIERDQELLGQGREFIQSGVPTRLRDMAEALLVREWVLHTQRFWIRNGSCIVKLNNCRSGVSERWQ